jgi:hypothetical protein
VNSKTTEAFWKCYAALPVPMRKQAKEADFLSRLRCGTAVWRCFRSDRLRAKRLAFSKAQRYPIVPEYCTRRGYGLSDRTDLIRYRREKASATLADTNLLLEAGSPSSAVNRIYYALFYVISALPLTKELSSAKHSGSSPMVDLSSGDLILLSTPAPPGR